MNQQDWILLVHLGPVQDFIASARKCRDLWFGSYLLSELSKAAALGIADQLSAKGIPKEELLVFPGKLDGSKSNVANKLQLIVHGTEAFVREVAEAGRASVQRKLINDFADPVFDQVRGSLDEDFLEEAARAHVDDLMEYMWVAVPLAENQADYAAQRRRAEGLLAARKNTRQWAAATANDIGVPKSSLDGLRESVIHERVYDKYRDNPDHLRRSAGIGESERLCGVGLLKRLAKPLHDRRTPDLPPVFHSAGHIASAGVRARIASSEEASAELENYLDTLEKFLDTRDLEIRAHEHSVDTHLAWKVSKAGSETEASLEVPRVLEILPAEKGLDGVVLYPSRLARIEKEYGKDEASLSILARAQKKVLNAIDIQEPNPYYALILGDGDKMGVALDGMKTSGEHRSFSEKLDAEFAVKCRDIVNEHGGSLLYAGGDDVLAMVPLFNALQCAEKLREKFNEAMAKVKTLGNSPTLSVGIAVCHYLEPLGRVREYAKTAEYAAKNKADRNAFAVLVKKRGGTEKIVYGKWDSGLAKRLHEWGELQAMGALSRGLAHKFEDAIQQIDPIKFVGEEKGNNDEDAPMIRSLLTRIALRRDLKDKHRNSLTELINGYFSPNTDPYEAVRRLSHELQIADLFGRSMREVWGESVQGADYDAAEAE